MVVPAASRFALALALATGLADSPAPAAPLPSPAAAVAPAASTGSATRTLPDSVLARVGAGRTVTVRDFRRSWDQLTPPQRPDSLTPQAAEQFLQLLTGKELLAERALREAWVWTRAESAKYVSTRDNLVLRAALERPLAEARAGLERAGLPADDQAAGRAARDSAAARLGAVYDDALLERLARAFQAVPKPSPDSGLFGQIRALGRNPVVDRRDSLAVVARTNRGDLRVCDLIAWWSTLNPLKRPTIATAEQTRDLVKNALFERELRREAETLGLERRPEIAAELGRQREYIAVTHLVQREVYDKIAMDSLTLLRFYERDPDVYSIPARVRALRLVLPTRADAGRMGARLRNRAEAESLAAQAGRKGLSYVVVVTAESDSALFAEGTSAGVGAVVGPDSVEGGWSVARVLALLPREPRTFSQARTLVEHQWPIDEGERLMAEYLERLRRDTTIAVNHRALNRLSAR